MISGLAKPRRLMHLADEMLDHLLRHLEVGDHAVAQRADGLDVARGAAEHLLGLLADGEHHLLAPDIRDGDYPGLVQHDPAAFDVDEGIGRAEVDGHVGRHQAKQSSEHPPTPSACSNRGGLPVGGGVHKGLGARGRRDGVKSR